ncbi:MAG: hypothetical protein M1165_02285 [Candidatus Pacearchaeota archaeon]|nr:hypothetical protein [Candidatus Pacearchaeota archaeon]
MHERRVMKNFSYEEEEKLRAFLFTNPHGDDSFVYPQPLVAGEELSPLMSAYSRTHIPMQERVLQFLDQEKTEQTRAFLPLVEPIVEIFRLPDGALKISRRTMDFNTEYVILHGHDSIEEETTAFGYSENIADITGKKLTGHPLIKPQVKSTRYLSYGKVLDMSLADEDVASLPNADRFVEYQRDANARYLDVTQKIGDVVFNHPYTTQIQEFLRRPENVEEELFRRVEAKQKKEDFFIPDDEYLDSKRVKIIKSLEDEVVRKDIGKFILDYSRVYLTAATKTSMGYSVDARVLGEIITGLISSPRIEDQKRGYSIWNEAKKIVPVLLGKNSHVHVDMWQVKNETELRNYVEERFGNIEPVIHGNKGVKMLTPRDIEMYTDRFNAALVVFPYVDTSLIDIMPQLSDRNVKEILAKAHQYRGEHDVLHPAISHGGLMFELVMGYHGYRDLFRHRRGSRSTQLLTTRLGFEIPEIFSVLGFDREYADWARRSAEVYEEARKTSRHVAEKLVPFGAYARALHSWQSNQVGYMGPLRGNIEKGNLSYVNVVREMHRQHGQEMPETTQYMRIDSREYPAELWKKGYGWWDATQKRE